MITAKSILTKLQKIKTADTNTLDAVHGAKSHRYEMHPAVPRSRLTAWENEHAVLLPNEYADFLTMVGNGPCGPGTGLLPFPHDNPNAGKTCKITHPITSEEADSGVRYEETVSDQHGFIRLANYGCAMCAVLILSGEFVGQVWLDAADSGDFAPFPPILHDLSRDDSSNSKLNFLEWYDDWLNCALDGRAIS